MNSKTAKAKRWTSAAPESARNPKGSDECYLAAVEALGPFKLETHEEADASNLSRNPFGLALCRQLAVEQVGFLARDYNGHTHQILKAPRTKQIIERITKIESLAGELKRHLESLDDMTRYYLLTVGTGFDPPTGRNRPGKDGPRMVADKGAAFVDEDLHPACPT